MKHKLMLRLGQIKVHARSIWTPCCKHPNLMMKGSSNRVNWDWEEREEAHTGAGSTYRAATLITTLFHSLQFSVN